MNIYPGTRKGPFASRRLLIKLACYLILLPAGTGLTSAASGAQTSLPGRQVKVSAICIGFGGNREEKLKLALDHLETAGLQHVDVAFVPEEFAGAEAETLHGPTTNAP